MTYRTLSEAEGCSKTTVHRATRELYPNITDNRQGLKIATRRQIEAIKEYIRNMPFKNQCEVPLETIQRLYQKLLDNGKISAKECRETFGMVCNNSVYAAFENNYYNGKPMLFYEEREGGQIWLKRME